MGLAAWSAVIGTLLIVMAIGDSMLARLPLSTSMLYLVVGVVISPIGLEWTGFVFEANSTGLEILAEIVVLLSLFTSGLKMSAGLTDGRWRLPLRLAVVSMLVTVVLVAVLGHVWLGLSLGAAVLLGGILAPTDPVLASAVQVARPGDRDRLRFALTGEGGLNDGTAFPIVFLGLGLLGFHRIGAYAEHWIVFDLLWAVTAGLAIGAGLGTLIGAFVLYLRRTHKEAVGLDNFLALGLIGLSYGLAIQAGGYGFLAVFAAGVALRRLERQEASPDGEAAVEQALARQSHDGTSGLATDSKHAPAYMTHAVLNFNEQLERIGEVAVVVTIGSLLWAVDWSLVSWGFVAAVLLVVRPIAVAVGLIGSRSTRPQRLLIGWFGIRGVGSLYYLMFAINQGLSTQLAATLAAVTMSVVVVSIVVHGVSVTPLMRLYETRKWRDRAR